MTKSRETAIDDSSPSAASNSHDVSTSADDPLLPAEVERSEAERELFIGEGNTRTTYPATCRHCKRFMTGVFTLDGRMTLWLLPYLTAVMQWLESDVVAPPPPPRYVPKQLRIFVRAAERGKRKRHGAPDCTSKETCCCHCRPPPEDAR